MAKPFVLAPDAGASVRAEAMATKMNCNFAALEKARDRVTGETSIKVPEGIDFEGMDVVVIDHVILHPQAMRQGSEGGEGEGSQERRRGVHSCPAGRRRHAEDEGRRDKRAGGDEYGSFAL